VEQPINFMVTPEQLRLIQEGLRMGLQQEMRREMERENAHLRQLEREEDARRQQQAAGAMAWAPVLNQQPMAWLPELNQ
jgi:hypothetical protein